MPFATRTFAAVAVCFAATVTSGWAQTSEAVALRTPTGTLAGTLQLPAGVGAHPLAVVIPGSGPTDRNGNTIGMPSGSDAYRMLADSLVAHGIATLRYDKRGIGESRAAMPAEHDLRFELAAADASAWVTQARADKRFSRVVIIGHSEGSLLGMLASSISHPDAFVSIAGPARRADEVIHEQLATRLPTAMQAQSDSVLARLVRGDTVVNPPAALLALYRPSVQPYLISWLRYSGATEIAKLTVPVLLVQGTHDLQVAPSEVDMLAAALPKARLALIPGMNHVLKITPASAGEQQRYYTDPSVPLPAALIDTLVTFIDRVRSHN